MKLINEIVYNKIFTGSGNVSGLEFGDTKIVQPIGTHKATIVWLHDIGHKGSE